MAKEPVTFVDEPGPHGADELFSSVSDRDPILAAVAPSGNDDLDEEPDLTTPEGAASAADARVADLQAQIAQLSGRLTERDTAQVLAQRQQEVNALVAQIAEKAELGLIGDIPAIQARLATLVTAAPPAAAPGLAPAWTSDLRADVKAWQARQDWIGVDGIRTAAMRQVDQVIDPIKFPTRDAYFKAVDKFIADAAGRQRGDNQLPTPTTGSGGARGASAATAPPAGGFREVKSVKELSGRDRQIAQHYIGQGLTEAAYLASYNETKRAATRAARRR